MTHFRSPALVLLLAVVLSSQLTYAQQNNSTSNDKSGDAVFREKAFKLLESLADQIGSLQSAENRARMGSNIAGSLWAHDEKRARALFASVEEDINLGLQRREDDRNAEQTFNVFLKLRDDTAERISRYDPELALSFLQRTEPVSDTPLPSNVLEREQTMKLRLAKKVAASNPEVAVKLARQSLAYRFSGDILTLLMRLSGKDKQQTQTLYKEVVDKIRDSDLTRYWPEWDFTQNLVRYFTPPAADDTTYRELVNIILNQALAKGCGKPRMEGDAEHPSFCGNVGGLLPYIDRYSPAQAGRLKHWVPENQQRGSTNLTQSFIELNELTDNGTVDEILALVSKYPDIEGQIYLRAVWKAESLGDLERAQEIASNYSGDPHVKAAMDARVKQYHLTTETIEAELARMDKDLTGVSMRQRIATLMGVGHFVAAHDRKMALRLLNQAEGLVNALDPGKEQTQYQIRLAMSYCFAKNDRGFAIIESLMPKLNELISAGAKLDGYDTRYLRDGEWNMTGEGIVGDMLTKLAQGAGYFAWCDFDRAVTLTTQFERNEIRMMAQLKLAQGILAGPSSRVFPGPLLY